MTVINGVELSPDEETAIRVARLGEANVMADRPKHAPSLSPADIEHHDLIYPDAVIVHGVTINLWHDPAHQQYVRAMAKLMIDLRSDLHATAEILAKAGGL